MSRSFCQKVDAIQVGSVDRAVIVEWSDGKVTPSKPWKTYSTGVDLPGGDYAWEGCWVVRDAAGEFKMYQDLEFKQLYSTVPDVKELAQTFYTGSRATFLLASDEPKIIAGLRAVLVQLGLEVPEEIHPRGHNHLDGQLYCNVPGCPDLESYFP